MSALFASDLLRMYQRYAERHGWKTEIIDSTLTGLGVVKDATMAVKAGRGTGAWSRLKYEGGVHRGGSGCRSPSRRAGIHTFRRGRARGTPEA